MGGVSGAGLLAASGGFRDWQAFLIVRGGWEVSCGGFGARGAGSGAEGEGSAGCRPGVRPGIVCVTSPVGEGGESGSAGVSVVSREGRSDSLTSELLIAVIGVGW
jgi:hypothetical protein